MPRSRKVEEQLAETLNPNPVEKVLAESAVMENVLVIGFDEEGEMTVHSTITNGPELLWALELAKSQILEMGVGLDD